MPTRAPRWTMAMSKEMSCPIPIEYTVALGGTWSEQRGHAPYPFQGRPPRVSRVHLSYEGGWYALPLLLPPWRLTLTLLPLLVQRLQLVGPGRLLQLVNAGSLPVRRAFISRYTRPVRIPICKSCQSPRAPWGMGEHRGKPRKRCGPRSRWRRGMATSSPATEPDGSVMRTLVVTGKQPQTQAGAVPAVGQL